ncbi:unnamed protein product [Psylliodes chrysocephalus]|uniref:Uncharacterized protein n=1 Tax=Psylliodes chrysocephalus TaxID=3402493 RepID=A0A9P0D3Z3_9CUCU|nr:unnamed protein product [Psylliodes chrysocephala]
MRGTGGGLPKIINIDSVDQSLKEILGSRITGMESEFDDDSILKAVENNKINEDDIIENQEEAGSSKIEVPQKLNWATYNPIMLKKPRSFPLLPLNIQEKINEASSNKAESSKQLEDTDKIDQVVFTKKKKK